MLHKITEFLIAVGPLGVFLLGFIDSAGIPVAAGMDALVILIGVKAPDRAYLTAFLAVLGSVSGNLTLFYIARRGGRRYAERHVVVPEPGKPQRFRSWFNRYGLATVFIPAVIPIPLPLKVFVVSAGVMRTSVAHFAAVIVTARVIRYFTEAYLAIRLGEDARDFLTRNALNMVGIAIIMAGVLYVIIRVNDRRRAAAGPVL